MTLSSVDHRARSPDQQPLESARFHRAALRVGVAMGALVGFAAGSLARGQCLFPRLSPPGVSAGDRSGSAVAASGRLLAIGAPLDDGPPADAGSVHLLQRIGARLVSRGVLAPPALARQTGAQLGRAVAVFHPAESAVGLGPVLFAGAHLEDTTLPAVGGQSATTRVDTGGVHLWRPSGDARAWVHDGRLLPADSAAGDSFGFALATDGARLIAGSNGRDGAAQDSGAAYLFIRDDAAAPGWIEEATLLPDDPSLRAYFGAAVAIRGDLALVGAWGERSAANEAGAAYVFQQTDGRWRQSAKLLAPAPAAGDRFGFSLAIIDSTTVAVGAPLAEPVLPGQTAAPADSGAVYIFTLDSGVWSLAATIVAPTRAAGDQFGLAIAADPTRLLIGAWRADATSGTAILSDAGAAWLYERNAAGDFQLSRELTPDTRAASDEFGFAVALSDFGGLAGARLADAPAADSGAAWAFITRGDDCDGDGVFDLCEVMAGTGNDCTVLAWAGTSAAGFGDGIPDTCQPDLDGDAVIDPCDNCPDLANPDQHDLDRDGLGNACDPCSGDASADGQISADDIFAYLTLWFAAIEQPASSSPADLNADAAVTADDLFVFLTWWFAVCE